MANDTDNTQYSMLVDISQKIGELKGEVHNVEAKINHTDTKIDEVVDALTKRQDFLHDGLEAEINSLRGEVKESKAEIKQLKQRIEKLEEAPKIKVFEIFEKFKSLLITAILTALVVWCMGVVKDIYQNVKPQTTVIQNTE